MAARKSVITPAPARPELDKLLEQARNTIVTEAQLQEQRASFAYGNAPLDSKITRESAISATKTVRLTHA